MTPLRFACAALACALLAASCAPLPPPGSPSAPPAPTPRPQPSAPPAPAPRPQPFRVDREPMLDVGLAWDLDSVVVTPLQSSRVASQRGTGETALGSVDRSVSVRRFGGAFEAAWRGADGVHTTTLGATDTLWIGSPDALHGANVPASDRIQWNAKTWRGRFKVFLNPRGRLTVAVRVPLESYLLGVVPGEIGALSDALVQAGRAQAIAARSYTLFYRGRRGAEGFDLYGTVEDQVYGPVDSEKPLATSVVQSTRGMVALSNGNPVRANYCSTCGGITADVWEAWPAEALPYLVSHRDGAGGKDYCETSPQYRWREEWAAADFLATIRRFAPPEGVTLPAADLGELVDVRVESRSHSGRAWRLVVETSAGTITIPAYVIRRVLRRPGTESILRSNLFKVGVRRDRATGRARTVVVSGAGSGHGVGLCQTGALGMARARLSGERILAHYYPGAQIKTLY